MGRRRDEGCMGEERRDHQHRGADHRRLERREWTALPRGKEAPWRAAGWPMGIAVVAAKQIWLSERERKWWLAREG
ncbi:hypothetical protein OIU78_019830, partial [Salix suchowensis]